MFLHLSVILFTGGVYPSMQWARKCIPACNGPGHVYPSMQLGSGCVSQHAMGQGVYPSMQWARGCVSQHAIGQWVCIPACNWTGGHEGVGIVIKGVCVGRVVNLWFALLLWSSGWEWPSVMTFWSTPLTDTHGHQMHSCYKCYYYQFEKNSYPSKE